MPLAGLESTTGVKISVVVGEPATLDLAGYEGLTYVQVVGVVSFGEWGDENADVNEPLLTEGRRIHTNGLVDGGSVTVNVQHRDVDAGSDILRASGGTNDLVTIKKEYKSGDAEYATAIISSAKFRSAENDAIRGYTCQAMVNTAVFEATAEEIAALP